MGSKHRLAKRLAEVFRTLPAGPAVDAFFDTVSEVIEAYRATPPGS